MPIILRRALGSCTPNSYRNRDAYLSAGPSTFGYRSSRFVSYVSFVYSLIFICEHNKKVEHCSNGTLRATDQLASVMIVYKYRFRIIYIILAQFIISFESVIIEISANTLDKPYTKRLPLVLSDYITFSFLSLRSFSSIFESAFAVIPATTCRYDTHLTNDSIKHTSKSSFEVS